MNENHVGEINRTKLEYKVRKWSTKHRYFYRVATSVMGGIVPLLFRYEYFGVENLTQFPEGTPLILVGNHRSHLDAMVAIASIFPPRGNLRYLTSITYGDIQKENFLFKMMRYVGGFPIDRENPELSLDYLYETLKAGSDRDMMFIFIIANSMHSNDQERKENAIKHFNDVKEYYNVNTVNFN